MVFPDKNNLAPRFGFLLDVLGNAKLCHAGGFGIFYDIEDGALKLAIRWTATLRRRVESELLRIHTRS